MALSDVEQRLARLFTAAVLGRFDVVRHVRSQAAHGEPDRRWREAVLQVHVFAGFPRLVETYGVLASLGGLGRPDADELHDALSDEDAHARGRSLFERIYREDSAAVRTMLESHDASFASWIEEHAYGRVLARPGLAADRRELLAVCALAALGQDRQLASHVRGALRCGATRDEVDAALHAVADLIEPARLERARELVTHFTRSAL